MIAGVAFVIGTTLLLIIYPPAAESFREWRLMRAASADDRRTAGRVLRMTHTPLSTKRGGPTAARATPLDQAAGRILLSSAPSLLRGKAALLSGRTSEAVEALRAAAASGGAEAHSDLAAALVGEAEELDAFDPALDAVIAARRAIASSRDLAPAHFNLALALQRLGLAAEARHEFELAARLEPGSSWAAEAMKRAEQMGRPGADWRTSVHPLLLQTRDAGIQRALIESDIEHARRFAEGLYLADWGQAVIDGCPGKARDLLELVRLTGTVIAQASGDQMVTHAADAIDRAAKHGRERVLDMARAHVQYRAARIAQRDRRTATALTLLAEAGRGFAQAGSPLQYTARYYTAAVLYEETRVEEALATVAGLDREELESRGYVSLSAQLEWERGISHLVRASYAEALQAFDLGYARSVAIGNREQAATFDGLAAEALEYLGDSRDAWSRRARALGALSTLRSVGAAERRTVTLLTAAQLQIAGLRFDRAEALLEYAVPQAVAGGDAVIAANAYAQRAVARAELRDAAGAAADRAVAAGLARKIPDSALRARVNVDLEVAEGVGRKLASPQSAVTHFTRAIDLLRERGQTALLPRLYFERARAHEAAGDVRREREDLRAVLDVIAGWEKSIRDSEQRAAISVWSDASRRALIALELRQKDVGAAFGYADARRTAGRQDAPLPARGALSSHIAIQHAIAPDAAVVEFVTTGDSMVAFVIRRSEVRATTLPARASRIAAVAEVMRNAEDDQLVVAAGALYDLVLAPIRHRLAGVRTIAVVPDRELTGIPFGALYDRTQNRFVAEDFALVHGPTASATVTWSRQAGAPAASPAMLTIGASVFDRKRYRGAAALSAVDRESESIARLWTHPRTLVGSNATPAAVARELSAATHIHYAGHIVGRGADARMLLAPAYGRSTLTAHDIAALDLGHVKVVILAACRGSGTSERHAIVQDMASGFLTAGVPTVVASATDVDDAEATETMMRLHRALAAGVDSADALRSTAQADRRAGKAVPLSIRLLVMGGSRALVR